MIITCSNCSTGYLLPEHLVGPGGARVRCPRCQHLFAVGVDGQPCEPVPPAPAPAPANADPPPGRPPEVAEETPAVAVSPPVVPADPPAVDPPAVVEPGPVPALEVEAEPQAGAEPEAVPEFEVEAEPDASGHLAVARSVLGQLALHEGEAMERAQAERRFFAEFGPALMVAYETYRRRAGADADPSAFRTALRERWGVELVPLTTREG